MSQEDHNKYHSNRESNMFPSRVSLVLLSCLALTNAQTTDIPLMASATEMPTTTYICGGGELSGKNDMSVFLRFDYSSSMVYITLEGPDDQWFGVGFGSTTMPNTYAIIVNGDGTVSERKLGILYCFTIIYIFCILFL